MQRIDDILMASPPDISEQEAMALVRRDYGKATMIQRLTSERDVNFRLRGPFGEAVLKVSNSAESHAISAMQSAILQHLRDDVQDLRVPRLIPTVQGQPSTLWSRGPEGAYFVRLFSLVKGERLEAPLTPAQAVALGRLVGELGLSLQRASIDFVEPDILWDITQADRVFGLVDRLERQQDRLAVAWAIEWWREAAKDRLMRLPVQICHNDINRSNVLFDAATKTLGIIDFGDAILAPAVVDLANAIAYFARADRLVDDAVAMASGYRTARSLSVEEMECLPALIAARLALVVAITGWRAALHPENRVYIMRNCAAARANLLAMMQMPPVALVRAFLDTAEAE